MNILLNGLMCSGKSTIGRLIADKLNYKFIEQNELVLINTGYSTIDEVYSDRYTLWLESEIEGSRELSKYDNQVIACCGDFVENLINIKYFQESSSDYLIILLDAPIEILTERVLKNRISISAIDQEKIKRNFSKLFRERDSIYRSSANHIIDASGSPQETIKRIISIFDKK